MRALSVRQPWASLLAIGTKLVETRTRPVSYRGAVAIHASKRQDHAGERVLELDQVDAALRRAGLEPTGLPRGAIVGAVNLEGVFEILEDGAMVIPQNLQTTRTRAEEKLELELGDYTAGRFGWVMGGAMLLEEPIPCLGRLGLWRMPDELRLDVVEALGGRRGRWD